MAHFVCSDLHGQYWAWKKIKENLTDEDTLIFLGDAIDRGSDGVQIMEELLTRPNTIYLMGNHEDMMVNYFYPTRDADDKLLCYGNIDEVTYEALKALSLEKFSWIMNQIRELPFEVEYTNARGITFRCSHAGYTPQVGEKVSIGQILWDREHYLSDVCWDEEHFHNVVIVHGHTPIECLCEDRAKMHKMFPRLELNPIPSDNLPNGSYTYCNGHKICVDCGVYCTNHTVLLNLDTLEEIILVKDN